MLPESYDPLLVGTSYVVAMLGSFAALSLAARLTAANGGLRKGWLFGGAFAQATGIWGMHFTGMLAFSLPVPIWYDVRLMALSFVVALAGSILALFLTQRAQLGTKALLLGGLAIGAGISGLHFMDMAAMRMAAKTHYDARWLVVAVVIAVLFGVASLHIGRRHRRDDARRPLSSAFLGALVMGIAIIGQHYSAMAAATFWKAPDRLSLPVRNAMPANALPETVLVATFVILVGALGSAGVDRRAGARATLSQRLLAAQENERRRIASVLHDDVGQLLTAVRLNIEGLSAEEQMRPVVSDSKSLIDEALERIRGLSLELRPSVLDNLGLAAAITWYANRIAERAGFTVSVVDSLGSRRLPEEIETAAFRIVQQALTNVARHAGARKVRILLRWQSRMLEVAVADDGGGFDVVSARARATAGASLGILDMEEMATLAGGALSVSSVPGKGSAIEVGFPMALD